MNIINRETTSSVSNESLENLMHTLVEDEISRQHLQWMEAVATGRRYTIAMALVISGAICFLAGLIDWATDLSLSAAAAAIIGAGTVGLIMGSILLARHRNAENRRLYVIDESGDITKEDLSHIRCLS